MSEGHKSNIYPAALITEGTETTEARVEKNTVHMYILKMYHLLMKVFLFLLGPSRLWLGTAAEHPNDLSFSIKQHGFRNLSLAQCSRINCKSNKRE